MLVLLEGVVVDRATERRVDPLVPHKSPGRCPCYTEPDTVLYRSLTAEHCTPFQYRSVRSGSRDATRLTNGRREQNRASFGTPLGGYDQQTENSSLDGTVPEMMTFRDR